MTNQEILEKIANVKKGRYLSLTKVKDLGQGITKESDLRMRVGVAYSNMAINSEKETGSLPWGEWVPGMENLVVAHKGNYYLRVTAVDPEHPERCADTIATRYIQNGNEISKEEVIAQIGEKKISGNASPVYNIKFENIVRIGG